MRFTPNLLSGSVFMHSPRCGKIPDKLSTDFPQNRRSNPAFHISVYSKRDPHIWGSRFLSFPMIIRTNVPIVHRWKCLSTVLP